MAASSSMPASRAPSSMFTASEKGMRKSEVVLRKVGVLHPHVFGERIAEFLRGIHPVKTALNVEADTGISNKTVSKWLEGASSPSGAAYHLLMGIYGPELFVFVDPDASPASLREAARVCAQTRMERQVEALQGKISSLWSAA